MRTKIIPLGRSKTLIEKLGIKVQFGCWAETIAPCYGCSVECCLGSHFPQRAFELTFFIPNWPLQLISLPADFGGRVHLPVDCRAGQPER
jgi:hypothetical protein